jgi:hypothetical protein
MSIFENAKDLLKATYEISNLETKHELVKLWEENHRLHEKVNELTQRLWVKVSMEYRDPFFYQKGIDTPHCTGCFRGPNNLAVPLIFGTVTQDHTRWDCPVCKTTYLDKKDRTYKPPISSRRIPYGPHGWMS